jgi:hypothetical protein
MTELNAFGKSIGEGEEQVESQYSTRCRERQITAEHENKLTGKSLLAN